MLPNSFVKLTHPILLFHLSIPRVVLLLIGGGWINMLNDGVEWKAMTR